MRLDWTHSNWGIRNSWNELINLVRYALGDIYFTIWTWIVDCIVYALSQLFLIGTKPMKGSNLIWIWRKTKTYWKTVSRFRRDIIHINKDWWQCIFFFKRWRQFWTRQPNSCDKKNTYFIIACSPLIQHNMSHGSILVENSISRNLAILLHWISNRHRLHKCLIISNTSHPN